jgi:hypothetical protein
LRRAFISIQIELELLEIFQARSVLAPLAAVDNIETRLAGETTAAAFL